MTGKPYIDSTGPGTLQKALELNPKLDFVDQTPQLNVTVLQSVSLVSFLRSQVIGHEERVSSCTEEVYIGLQE